MKRDMVLIKKIMIEMEKLPLYFSASQIHVDGHSENEISCHIILLHDMGFIAALDTPELAKLIEYKIPNPPTDAALRITWKGYDYLEKITKN